MEVFNQHLGEFAGLLVYGLAILSVAGVLITGLQTVVAVLFLGRTQRAGHTPRPDVREKRLDAEAPPGPRVSILKPVCGLEDGLEQNLASFVGLTGVIYEVIISVARRDDPALTIIESVSQRFPSAPFRLVVGGARGGTGNPKVERLIAAASQATGDIFFISDSNVRVAPDDIARTIRHFDDPGVGCVSNPFVGEGASTIGAWIESLYLLTFVLPGSTLAHAFGVPCVIGKSMAIRRDLCETLGGFEAFLHRMAEDQAIGLAVKVAGYKVALSPAVVRNTIERRTIRAALSRQIRWGKLRYSFSKWCYSAEFLVNPFPLALLAWIMSGLAPRISCWPVVLMGLVLVARLIETRILAAAAGARLSAGTLLLVPVQDILQAGTQLAPYWSREVIWRGYRRRLGRGTEILAPAE